MASDLDHRQKSTSHEIRGPRSTRFLATAGLVAVVSLVGACGDSGDEDPVEIARRAATAILEGDEPTIDQLVTDDAPVDAMWIRSKDTLIEISADLNLIGHGREYELRECIQSDTLPNGVECPVVTSTTWSRALDTTPSAQTMYLTVEDGQVTNIKWHPTKFFLTLLNPFEDYVRSENPQVHEQLYAGEWEELTPDEHTAAAELMTEWINQYIAAQSEA